MSRREFLILGGAASATLLAGCATNPVTGERQFMLMSEQQEVEADKSNAPHQFSADYGPMQDAAINRYMEEVGQGVASVSHRPGMPYSFRALNAVNVNAYTFPAGSVGITRGILLSMEDESELAALIGHEVGHVSYRHTASRMSKAMLTQLALVAVVGVVSYKYSKYTTLAAGLGTLGSGLLLANYSRADERQADDSGQAYLVKAGYHPEGMVHLMERLVALNKQDPSALEVMFSSHPMSIERYDAAVRRSAVEYAQAHSQKTSRERYMDITKPIRAQKDAIVAMQEGLDAMGANQVGVAEDQYRKALALQPDDYAGLLTMAKIQLAQNKYDQAREYANRARTVYPEEPQARHVARTVYPEEPQARHVAGLAALNKNQFEAAYADFSAYDRMLPGNPNLAFYKGFTLDKMGRQEQSAEEYQRFLQSQAEGDQAEFATSRLTSWGYIKDPQPAPAPAAAEPANVQKPKKRKKKKN